MKISDIQTNNPLALIDDGVFYPRKFKSFLETWKAKRNHFPLVIKGLRQSGKTKAILYFSIENYESVFYIDFRNHPEYAKLFIDYDIDRIKERLSVEFGFTRFIESKSLFIFDEIQDCPIARGSLKNFALDGRYDVIASGSLLGISGYNEDMKQYIPVGYEEIVHFYPMDFEEFAYACGYQKSVFDTLKTHLEQMEKIDDSIHQSMLKLFRLYILVGGMPSVVKTYLNTRDLVEVRNVQRRIVDSYRDDFGTHLKPDGESKTKAIEKAKINRVLDSMPSQLSKENTTKFTYNLIDDSHAKGEKYTGAIQWLIDYGLLVRCPNLDKIDTIQAGYASQSQFKLYFADTGLFCSQLDASISRSVLFDEYGIFKGCIYENIVADAFSKNGKSLYYYSDTRGTEIDFITKYKQYVALTEVKANAGKTRSADKVYAQLNDPKNYIILKLTAQNIDKYHEKLTIPYYLASFLPKDEDVLKDITFELPIIE